MLFNKTHLINTALALSVLSLSACATTQPAAVSRTESFGKAVNANLAAQIVAPTDAQKANTYIPANRARRELAYKAYEEDDTERLPESITTNGN